MILKNFFSQYINEDSVEDIVFHNWSIIFKDSIRTIILLAILFCIYFLLKDYIQQPFFKRIFIGLGILLLIKYSTDIFNKIIDCIILSKQWITFFSRDGIRKNKTEFFWRDAIETISHEQKTFWDKIFLKGNIKIQLDHGITYDFEQVNMPKKQIKKIMKLKENAIKQKTYLDPKQPETNNEQISLLTEVLSDVIKEYLEKKEEHEL